MAIAGAPEFSFFLSHIRAGNDPSHTPLILHGNLPGDLTAAVQLIQAESLFVAADLQDRIRGRIYDHMSCGDLFLSQLIQDLCSAGAFVAYYLMSGLFFQLPDQFRRESVLRK